MICLMGLQLWEVYGCQHHHFLPISAKGWNCFQNHHANDAEYLPLVVHPTATSRSTKMSLVSIDDGWVNMDMIRSMGGVPERHLNCCLTCKVCNDYCGQSTGGYSRVWLPDKKLIDRYYVAQDWYETEFIMGFVFLSIHDTHTSQPLHPSDHKVLPVITMYPNSVIHNIKNFDVDNTTHFVSVVFAKNHFALLYYDLAGCTVSVFDGLEYDIKTWSQHISHTLWTYGLVSMAKNPTITETNRYYQMDGRQKDGVQDRRKKKLTLEYQSVEEDSSPTCVWTVCNEASYTQQDGFDCGPLACLKLMEINGRVVKGTIETILSGGHDKTVRWVVMDYFENCIERYYDNLKVERRTGSLPEVKAKKNAATKKIEEKSSIAMAVIKDGDVAGVEIGDVAGVEIRDADGGHAKAVIKDNGSLG